MSDSNRENQGVKASQRIGDRAVFGVGGESSAGKPRLSTHVLDTSRGVPAKGVPIRLYGNENDGWTLRRESTTDENGRCALLTSEENLEPGRYKIEFGVGKYFGDANVETMFPVIEIIFDTKDDREHYHVPLLLSPFGFTTYRGS